MEFLTPNLINTTTMIAVDSETITASNLINRNKDIQYVSYGYNNDDTQTSIVISFDQTTAVDRIVILNHNLADFTIFYNGTTANTFNITGYTSSSDFGEYVSNDLLEEAQLDNTDGVYGANLLYLSGPPAENDEIKVTVGTGVDLTTVTYYFKTVSATSYDIDLNGDVMNLLCDALNANTASDGFKGKFISFLTVLGDACSMLLSPYPTTRVWANFATPANIQVDDFSAKTYDLSNLSLTQAPVADPSLTNFGTPVAKASLTANEVHTCLINGTDMKWKAALDQWQTSTGSDFTGTSHYFPVTQVNVTSVTFDLHKTKTADAEKAIGYLYLGTQKLDFGEWIPSAKNFDPVIDNKQIVHELSDGGTRIHTIQTKWKHKFKLDYISSDFRDDLEDIYNDFSEFVFVPFNTVTGWDKIFYECVWVGDFNFYEYSDNAGNAGFSGKVDLRETAY